MFLVGFPLLIIPLAIFNMIVFLTPGVRWTDHLATVQMPSGAEWSISFADALVALSLLLLLVEMVKATRLVGRSVVDHLLSLLVLAAAVAELVMVAPAASSTFATVAAICVVDFLAGIAASRRGAARARVELARSDTPSPATG